MTVAMMKEKKMESGNVMSKEEIAEMVETNNYTETITGEEVEEALEKELPRLFQVPMFVSVTDDKFAEYDVHKGDVIYLAGEGTVCIDEDDPYTVRRIFQAAWVEDGHLMDKKGLFLIDPARLAFLPEDVEALLLETLEEDFGQPEEANDGDDSVQASDVEH